MCFDPHKRCSADATPKMVAPLRKSYAHNTSDADDCRFEDPDPGLAVGHLGMEG